MGRAGVALLALVAAAACVPAEAVAALPIRVPRVHTPPPVELRIPASAQHDIAAAAQSGSRYGTGVPEVETRLDATSVDAIQAVEDDIARIGRTAAARERLRECIGSGLQSTAEGYGQAMVDRFTGVPSDFPGVYESFQSAAYSCIGDQIEVPANALDATATYLSGRIHAYFEGVAATTSNGPAHQRWLQVTADQIAPAGTGPDSEVTGGSGEETFESPPATDTGDSPDILPWLGGAALLLAVVLVVWRPWRTS
jgi:hypothetical protein